jgi:hypothetical protein
MGPPGRGGRAAPLAPLRERPWDRRGWPIFSRLYSGCMVVLKISSPSPDELRALVCEALRDPEVLLEVVACG